jgi:hypothetical protein
MYSVFGREHVLYIFCCDCISTLPTSWGAAAENYRCESYGAIEPQPQQTGADKPHIGSARSTILAEVIL